MIGSTRTLARTGSRPRRPRRISRREPCLNGRCTLLVMRRTAVRVFVTIGLLAVMLATASAAGAAGEVVVSASPSEVRVGQPIEILVRTFVPIQREGTLAAPDPREPYPGPSGFWNVLYPWDDYPFDVVAQHEDGTEVPLALARDPTDSTLWRGFTSLPKAGTWTIWVRNFPSKGPGSTTVVKAEAGPPASIEPASSSTTTASGSIDAGPAALVGVSLGLLGGYVIARQWRRGLPS